MTEDDYGSSKVSTHSIVRGFSPSNVSSFFRSQTCLAPSSILKPSPLAVHAERLAPKKNMFMLGGSYGEDESLLEERTQPCSRQSSVSDGQKQALGGKKRTSKDEVATRTICEWTEDEVFREDDDEDVEDEDSSDWEDSVDYSGHSSIEDRHLFQRVNPRPNLTSCRSLITILLHESKHAATLANAGSRSTPAIPHSSCTRTPNGPSVTASPGDDSPLMMCAVEGPCEIPGSQTIIATSNMHPPAPSPRTNRRNMLATELTESLRRHLLWERQQKVHGGPQTVAAMKRRHTAQDMRNLQEHPQKAYIKGDLKSQNDWTDFGQKSDLLSTGW